MHIPDTSAVGVAPSPAVPCGKALGHPAGPRRPKTRHRGCPRPGRRHHPDGGGFACIAGGTHQRADSACGSSRPGKSRGSGRSATSARPRGRKATCPSARTTRPARLFSEKDLILRCWDSTSFEVRPTRCRWKSWTCPGNSCASCAFPAIPWTWMTPGSRSNGMPVSKNFLPPCPRSSGSWSKTCPLRRLDPPTPTCSWTLPGRSWLELFRGMSERDRPQEWLILDADGTWLGTVEVPDGFTVMEIRMDTMLGVLRDELDVEHPQVLRLNRTGN